MRLFIDSNIYLSFYHLSKDDLVELEKLVAFLVRDPFSSNVLYVTDHLLAEISRNREKVIKQALGILKEQNLGPRLPNICKEHVEHEELEQLRKQFHQTRDSLYGKVLAKIEQGQLRADRLIQELHDRATRLDSSKLVDAARLRVEVGNPPKKEGSSSIGDSLNWETLLQNVPEGEDLFFISEDKDYCSEIGSPRFNDFLQDEWKTKKKSKVILFRRLSEFFTEAIPDINFASEIEKDIQIQELKNSGFFRDTHNVIARLQRHPYFTISEATDILQATLANNQVSWIAKDEDVSAFLNRIIDEQSKNLDLDLIRQVQDLLDS